MTQKFKTFGMVIISSIAAVAILVTAYVANGSEREDAWLYIFCIWLVLFGGVEAYSALKKNKGK